MMTDVFNTLFEVSLRALLVLETVKNHYVASDMIAAGIAYCSKFENEYAESYRALAQKTWEVVSQKPERAVIELINRHSVSSVKRGEISG